MCNLIACALSILSYLCGLVGWFNYLFGVLLPLALLIYFKKLKIGVVGTESSPLAPLDMLHIFILERLTAHWKLFHNLFWVPAHQLTTTDVKINIVGSEAVGQITRL